MNLVYVYINFISIFTYSIIALSHLTIVYLFIERNLYIRQRIIQVSVYFFFFFRNMYPLLY